jgi:hypothetical protein
VGEFVQARIGKCKCGQRLIVTVSDGRGRYLTHHTEPHCAAYQAATRGQRHEIIPTAVIELPRGVAVSTKPGDA